MPFDNNEIDERLTRVFRKVFRQPELKLRPEMTAADVEDWDSLSHINLIAAVEKEFKVRFSTSEIMGLANVGNLDALIRKKAGA
jgi:acyl carrier protein